MVKDAQSVKTSEFTLQVGKEENTPTGVKMVTGLTVGIYEGSDIIHIGVSFGDEIASISYCGPFLVMWK